MTQHEIAKSKSDGYYHILVKRDSAPHADGIATGTCGMVGWHTKSTYIEERFMCINRHNIPVCSECMEILKARSIVRFL